MKSVVIIDPRDECLPTLFRQTEYRVTVYSSSEGSEYPRLNALSEPAGECGMACFSEFDSILLCTPIAVSSSWGADSTILTSVSRIIGPRLRAGQLVVVVGQVPPGLTRLEVSSALASRNPSIVRHLSLAHAWQNHLGRWIISGIDDDSLRLASNLFERIGAVQKARTLETSEICSTCEDAIRAIHSALRSEIGKVCSRMDVAFKDILELCGGLLPVDEALDRACGAYFLASSAIRVSAKMRILDDAIDIHESHLRSIVSRIFDCLNDSGKALRGSRVAIIVGGAGCNPEPGHRTAIELKQPLRQRGAIVNVFEVRDDGSALQVNESSHQEPVAIEQFVEYLQCEVVLVLGAVSPLQMSFLLANSHLLIDAATQPAGVYGEL